MNMRLLFDGFIEIDDFFKHHRIIEIIITHL